MFAGSSGKSVGERELEELGSSGYESYTGWYPPPTAPKRNERDLDLERVIDKVLEVEVSNNLFLDHTYLSLILISNILQAIFAHPSFPE